jgi:hypothetical protein
MGKNDSRFGDAKDLMVIAREILTVVFIGAIYFFPQLYANWSNEMGKDLVAGGASHAKTKTPFGEADYGDDAKQIVAGVLASTYVPYSNGGQQTVEQIQKVSAELALKLPSELQKAETATAQNNPSPATSSSASGEDQYGIVVSADKRDDLAEYEVSQLQRRNLPVFIYERQGFIRTVAHFPSRAAADANLDAIHSYRKTAYIVDLSKWCSNPEPTDKKIDGISIRVCAQGPT